MTKRKDPRKMQRDIVEQLERRLLFFEEKMEGMEQLIKRQAKSLADSDSIRTKKVDASNISSHSVNKETLHDDEAHHTYHDPIVNNIVDIESGRTKKSTNRSSSTYHSSKKMGAANPFAPRIGRRLTWTKVNMTLVRLIAL